MTISNFIANYKKFEARSQPAAAGKAGVGGKAFLKEDRAALVGQMWDLKLTHSQAGHIIGKELGNIPRHVARLKTFEDQVDRGRMRMGYAPTGEYVGEKPSFEFDGRIKALDDIQPAFNRAARQLIKLGITDPTQVVRYVNTAFATARVEQKIDTKADRIVKELRIGDLTKAEVLLTLDRVKSQF